jgi:Cu-processing system permease protein
MKTLVKYVLYDILRNRMVIAYTIFLLLVSISLFYLEDNPAKGTLGLLNIVLIVLPLVSIIFATIHFYNSYEFIELLVAQPLQRKQILISEYIGICSSLILAFLIGIGVPILLFNPSETGFALIFAGVTLTAAFVSLAFFASVISRDKAKGIGIALMLWFYFALIYDGLVLFFLFSFSDYPLEKMMVVLTALNPIDLGRIVVMLKMDVSALMGYTGAVYKDFFGTNWGMFYALAFMLIWIIVPFAAAIRFFEKKDL